jgi:hypothetical protein
LSVQYTDGKQAAIGRFGKPPSSGSQVQNDKALTLWWQAPQHAVQYRSGLTSKLPSWGLPELFRARAIKSLLPVVPRPPLPTVDFSDGGLGAWQAVLPGVLRYWLSGTRAGVMIAIRNQLLRQSGLEGSQIGSGLVSGSVPVQHRTPRPVPLPANRDRDTALQPWASYFEPQRNLLVSPSPADEAFFAATGAEPARRLRMVLVEPARGAVTAGWNGDLVFEIVAQDDGQTDLPIGVEWVMLEAVGQDGMLGYQQPAVPDDPERPDRHRFVLQGDLEKDRLRQLLSGRQPGDVLVVQARVGHDIATDGFYQTLSFPLRLIDEAKHRLPLEPQFIHFEDPEYNRRLASSAATATGTVKLGEDLHTVTLAADRREYNADSRLFLRYDWDDGDKNRAKGKMELYRIDKAGVPIRLAADGLEAIPPGKLVQVALGELRPGLAAEETLQLKLVLPDAEPIFLPLKVVEAPVIPAPEAAYALLRWHQGDDQVECARFAWRPNASLVELVCPDDLRTEMVRRRAVFHWNDTVRPTTLGGYYVQKIAPNGATHIPGRAEG